MAQTIATLILPNADNAGVALNDVHASLQADLCDTFGGFTATDSHGGWKDDAGKVHLEAGTVYAIAMESSADNDQKLRDMAQHVGHMAGQVCVMITLASGVVEFVYMRTHSACAAPFGWASIPSCVPDAVTVPAKV